MSFDDDHEIVKHIKAYNAGPSEMTLDDIAINFATIPHGERTEVLQKMDAWFSAPSSSRKTAQLFELNRKMKQVHRGLRMLGR
jgi:hypothetical protein